MNSPNTSPQDSHVNTGGGSYVSGNIDTHGGKFIGRDEYNLYLFAPHVIPILHSIPAPVLDFTGRSEEIEQLGRALHANADVVVAGIQGMGGIGKTQLALVVAQQVAQFYPDAQIMIPLGGAGERPLTPEQALQYAVRAFAPAAQLPPDLEGLQGLYNALLNGKRVLILADDVKDARQVRRLLPPQGCALLLTSRRRFVLPGMYLQDLNVLSPSEAEALVLKICPRIRTYAAELTRLCGYLPLALRVSASLLEDRPSRKVDYYLAQLEAERLKWLSDPGDIETSVEASLVLSYQSLTPEQQKVLCQLSVFAAAFDLAAAEATVHKEDSSNISEKLEALQTRSLLEWDPEKEQYRLHDLVRVFALHRLNGLEEVTIRYVRYFSLISRKLNRDFKQGGDSMLEAVQNFDRDRLHIDAIWAYIVTHSQLKETLPILIEFAESVVDIGRLRCDVKQQRIPLFEAAILAARTLGKKLEEASFLNHLGLCYKDLGDFIRAREFYEQALIFSQENNDPLGEQYALRYLGEIFRNLGNATKAIDLYEKALLLSRKVGSLQDEGDIFGKLGVAYDELNNTNQAMVFYEKALEISCKIGDKINEAHWLRSLGMAYAKMGDTQKAIVFYEQALLLGRELGDRRSEAYTLANLGLAYKNLHDVNRAIICYQQSLILTRHIGDQCGEAFISWYIGVCLVEHNDLQGAIELMQVCINFEKEISHPDVELDSQYVEHLRRLLTGNTSATDITVRSGPRMISTGG